MSSLRRDLVERKLWMVVATLLVAVVAVPVLLLKGASASTTPTVPAPPAATATSAKTTTTAPTPSAEPVKVVLARIARDPFASGVPKLSSKPVSQKQSSSSSATGSSATSATASPSTSASTVAMVSPSPDTGGPSSSGTSSSGSTPSTTATAPSTSTSSAAPTSTIASTSPGTQATMPVTVPSWALYSVSVRFGKDLRVPLITNIARLTPLPNIVTPQAMFMGVMASGRSAVFALHAGVGHTGQGLCRPDHTHCPAIVLRAGQTEHLSVPTTNGGHQDLVLRVVEISSSVTHSRKVALDAYHRVNDAGQCELDLANPVSYDPVMGTISSVVKNACQKHPRAVPFGYLVTAP
jgi:hypothetical protein